MLFRSIDGHEKVLLSCVIGVKDPYKMQKVKAFVVLRPGCEPSDAVKQEIAAKRRAEEAEKERQRALRREQNPDGITDNVSKKKIRQQEKEAAEKAAKAYEARKNPVQESEEKKPLSGDPERPYSRGRAYDPAHYGRKRPAGSDAEQTEE